VRWLNLKLATFVVIPVVAATAAVGWVFPGSGNAALFAGFAVFLIAVFVAFSRYGGAAIVAKKNYEARFKREVVAEIVRVVVPGASYEPFIGLDRGVFDESGLFLREGEHSSDDRVRGRIGPTPFEAAEVKRTYKASSKSGLRPVFHGLFMQLAFAPVLRGTTIIDARSAHNIRIGDRSSLTVLRLDHEALEREFQVYTNDEPEARTIVTPAMMSRLPDLRARIGYPVFLSFRGNRVYIGVHHRRKLFQPRVARGTSLATVEQMADEFALAELVVQHLGLNQGAGADALDDSVLRAKDAQRSADQVEALTSGMLSEEQYDRLEDDAIRTMRAAIERGSVGTQEDEEEDEKKNRRLAE
jgi:hypothetical protein